MSRSRKKVSSFSDYSRSSTKWSKRQASKKVRRFKKTIADGNGYRKVFPCWDIFDYKSIFWDPFDEWYERGLRK